MLAMTYRGPCRVRVEHKPMPRIEHPFDAIVRVTRSCICDSDLHLYQGLMPDTRVGHTFGHEFTGIVEVIGSGVRKLKVGDAVTVPFNISCGSCFFCSRGIYGNCHRSNPSVTVLGGIFGYSHTAGGYDGGQAEYVRVPYADVGPTLIPEWMDVEDAVLLTDVCPSGYQAAEMAEIREDDTVVVFGAGPIGLMAAKSAWLMGAGRVIVIDHVDYRLDFARRWARAETYNFHSIPDPVPHIKRLTDGLGADSCIDAVGGEAGAPTALNRCIDSVRKGGTVSLVGIYAPPYNRVPRADVVNKGIRINASQTAVKRYIPHLIEHIQEGRLKPSEMITHRIPLEEVAEGYHRFSSKLDECIKTMLIPPRAA